MQPRDRFIGPGILILTLLVGCPSPRAPMDGTSDGSTDVGEPSITDAGTDSGPVPVIDAGGVPDDGGDAGRNGGRPGSPDAGPDGGMSAPDGGTGGRCSVNNGGCSPEATCFASISGSVICQCNAGFTGDGFTCAPAVTCNGGCDRNASCIGSVCVCNEGYSGDGMTCTALPSGGVGSACSPMSATQCLTGLTCQPMGASAMCTRTGCTQNSDCGSSGDIENLCLNGECYRGCDPLVAGSCGRPDFGCWAEGGNHCVPGCSGPDAAPCPYGTICDATSNVCEAASCTTTCPNGDVCASVYGQQRCVPDCRQDETICPAGTVCSEQGVCTGLSDVGVACANGTSQSQSDCQTSYTCEAIGTVTNQCTLIGCVSDADCGTNGSQRNVCLVDQGSGQGTCWRGCDPADPASCGRPDLVCQPSFDHASGTTVNLCVADCRLQGAGYCPYGTTCSNGNGFCESTSCTGTGQSTCGAGDVCANVNGQSVCATDCRMALASPCPTGTACATDGTCSSGADVGAPCLDSGHHTQSNCAAGFTCSAQNGFNMCTQPCHFDADCGTNGGTPNVCVIGPGGDGSCFRGCAPGDVSSCGRPEFVCATAGQVASGTPESICVADCRAQPANFCPAGTTCNAADGLCEMP